LQIVHIHDWECISNFKFFIIRDFMSPFVKDFYYFYLLRTKSYVICEDLLFKSVFKRQVHLRKRFLLNKKNTFEIWMDCNLFIVRANTNLASYSLFIFLIVLIEHIIERLVDVLKIQQYACETLLNAIRNLFNQLISSFLSYIIWKVASIKYFRNSSKFNARFL
jgi:hypothetical protein